MDRLPKKGRTIMREEMNKILLNDNIDYTEHQAENQRQEVLKSQQSIHVLPGVSGV